MDKAYNHQLHEQKIYDLWQELNAFAPVNRAKSTTGKTFTISMPPPNANDPLHIGHAMFSSLEDLLIRFHRMLGDKALWLPGTDHAGIETQFVFEKKLKKNNQSRFQFDRETLYKMIWDYVQQNSDIAVNQLKKMGASADWDRFTFMLDPNVVDEVLNTFQKLHDAELVYRDLRLVNFCTHCGTAFSELEVNHVEKVSPMYYLKYGPFTIATVRPETKFRDTALAVNPKDGRYNKYLGQKLSIMGLLGPIEMTVIADEEVDPEFGTGIMKVTPAHDAHDFELGKKYDLPVTPIIDFRGRMDFSWFINDPSKHTHPKYLERAQNYHGKKINEARKLMRADLEADGLLVKVDENYTHNEGVCYRCGTTIEPLPLPQFFIKVKPLTKPVLTALRKKDIKVIGAGHDKILAHWLENLKDWNISRQIVWGIRMPIWYSLKENPTLQITYLKNGERTIGTSESVLAANELETAKAGLQELRAPMGATYVLSRTSPGPDYLQETDTFDTWFSSSQWPFATLKAQQPDDFNTFYPTQVMETGYDILPFWVMRMLMVGKFATGQFPFSTVYLHGLIRDAQGKKMSKSKGNVINPLTIVEQYGADALRMALIIRSSAGLDKSVGDSDFRAMRNFTNKIWNAARYVLMGLDEEKASTPSAPEDQAFLTKLNDLIAQVTQQLSDYRLGMAADTVYDSFWHWFCDIAIEDAKTGKISQEALLTGLLTFLKLLHPFMPFVTEAVWQSCAEQHPELKAKMKAEQLITAAWPTQIK